MRINYKMGIAAMLVTATVAFTVSGSTAYANFGSGVAAMAEGTEIVKTAICGKKIVFSDVDFKQGLCLGDFEKIKITSVPPSGEGTLLLAGRKVGAGTTIKRKNLGALVFIPASKDIKECRFKFTTDDFANGAEVDFVIKFTEKVNYAPTAATGADGNSALETQREISIRGKMKATDHEGDTLEYNIIKYPTAGNIKVIDKTSGEFLYTPSQGYVGTDEFTYVARDEWGNYSRPEKISIKVSERMCEVVYADMTNRKEYSAAIALTAMGIMDGRLLGDGIYFMPDKEVSAAEFITMAMKSYGIKPDTTLTSTFFDDNADIPEPYLSYVATAQKLGIVTGTFVEGKLLLCPAESITRTEAAIIMANILDKESTVDIPTFSDINTVPVWAKDAVRLMCEVGIFDSESEKIEGDATLTRAECAEYLYKLMKK